MQPWHSFLTSVFVLFHVDSRLWSSVVVSFERNVRYFNSKFVLFKRDVRVSRYIACDKLNFDKQKTPHTHLFFSFDLMDNGVVFIFNGNSRRVCGVGKGQQCFVLRLFHAIKAVLLPALGQLNAELLLTGRCGNVRLFREKPEKIITKSVSQRKSNRPEIVCPIW